jgi:hypothetical protein
LADSPNLIQKSIKAGRIHKKRGVSFVDGVYPMLTCIGLVASWENMIRTIHLGIFREVILSNINPGDRCFLNIEHKNHRMSTAF